MAITDAAEAAGAAIEAMDQKVQASAAHINMLVVTLQAMTIGQSNGDAEVGMTNMRQGLLFNQLALKDGILQDRAFLARLARELGQHLDAFDIVQTLQEAINRRQAGPLLAAFERAVFGSNSPIIAGTAGVRGSA